MAGAADAGAVAGAGTRSKYTSAPQRLKLSPGLSWEQPGQPVKGRRLFVSNCQMAEWQIAISSSSPQNRLGENRYLPVANWRRPFYWAAKSAKNLTPLHTRGCESSNWLPRGITLINRS